MECKSKNTSQKLILVTFRKNKFLKIWCKKSTLQLQKFPSLKLTWFKKTGTYLTDTPRSLLLQVLTIPPSGSTKDQKSPKQTEEKDSLRTLRVSKISQKDFFQQ